MKYLLVLLALVGLAGAVPLFPNMDGDNHNAAYTEDWPYFFRNFEGLYAVVYHAKVVTADTLEIMCVNGAAVTTNLVSCRIMLADTLPTLTTTLPVEILLYRTSTFTTTGTALTEFRLDQAATGTITSAWDVNPTDANGTLVAAYWAKPGQWFTLPPYLTNTGTCMIGIVLAQKSYVSFEAIWTEEE